MKTFGILPAKTEPFESLYEHNQACGRCASVLLNVFSHAEKLATKHCRMTDEQFVNYVSFLASVHDVGKAHPVFVDQLFRYLPSDVKASLESAGFNTYPMSGFRHEQYSGIVLKRYLKDKLGINTRRNRIAKYTANVVTLHHDHKAGNAMPELPADCKAIYEEAQDELISTMAEEFHFTGIPEICDNASEVFSFIEAIIILADHISSAFGHGADFKALVRDMGLGRNMVPDKYEIPDLFPFINEESMRPLQKAASKINGKMRMIIVEDIPGAGKTEAAMRLAFKQCTENDLTGFYFALPAATLCNQMYDRLQDMYLRIDPSMQTSLRLTHGTAAAKINTADSAIEKESSAEDGTAFLQPSRRALLSSAAVGTVDQIMMSVLKVRFACIRLLGLSNKVIVIDEIHAYDTYMSSIIQDMLAWCRAYEIPVILLSATLPTEKKREYLETIKADVPDKLSDEYPLITTADCDGTVSEIKVSAYKTAQYHCETVPYLNKPGDIAELAVSYAKKGGCIAVFANTVRDAQAIYRKVSDSFDGPILFHAQYTMGDRRKIEEKVVGLFGKEAVHSGKRPESSIIICTQVAEQSLDVDFDLIITQLCPIDLLIQRIGREHRFSDTKRPDWAVAPKVIVLTGDLEKSGTRYVYAPYILQKTEQYLAEHKTIALPNDVRSSVDYVYGETDIVEAQMRGYADEYAAYLFGESNQKNIAETVAIPQPDADSYFKLASSEAAFMAGTMDDNSLEVGATTRLGDATVRVILTTKEQFEQYLSNPHSRTIANRLLDSSIQLRLKQSYERIQNGLLKGYAVAYLEGKKADTKVFLVDGSDERILYSPLGASIK